MTSGCTLHKIAIIVGAVSLVLQIVGYTCPGWIVVTVNLDIVGSVSGTATIGFGEISSYASVWYTQICVIGIEFELCDHQMLHDDRSAGFKLSTTLLGIRQLNWTEVEIVLTLAIGLCMLSLVLALIGLCHHEGLTATLMTALASGAMFISWVLILPAVIEVALAIHDTNNAIGAFEREHGQSYTSVRTPWALVLSGCGMLLGLVSCILLLVSSCKHSEKKSRTITPDTTPERPSPILHLDTKEPFGFPIITRHMFMREGTEPHMPPQYNQDMLPTIGSKDIAPLELPAFGLGSFDARSEFGFDPPVFGEEMMMMPPGSPPLDTTFNQSKQLTRENTTVEAEEINLPNVVNIDEKPTKVDNNAQDGQTSVGKGQLGNSTVKSSTGFKGVNHIKDNIKPVKRPYKGQQRHTKDDSRKKTPHIARHASDKREANKPILEESRTSPQQEPRVSKASGNSKDTGSGLEYV